MDQHHPSPSQWEALCSFLGGHKPSELPTWGKAQQEATDDSPSTFASHRCTGVRPGARDPFGSHLWSHFRQQPRAAAWGLEARLRGPGHAVGWGERASSHSGSFHLWLLSLISSFCMSSTNIFSLVSSSYIKLIQKNPLSENILFYSYFLKTFFFVHVNLFFTFCNFLLISSKVLLLPSCSFTRTRKHRAKGLVGCVLKPCYIRAQGLH